jgi:histidinol dehydrogenase
MTLRTNWQGVAGGSKLNCVTAGWPIIVLTVLKGKLEITMINIYALSNISQEDLLRIKTRAQSEIDKVRNQVEEIIEEVKRDGDAALIALTRKWDDPDFDKSRLRVNERDIQKAYTETSFEVIEKIREQISLSRKFHRLQKRHITDWQEEMEGGITVGEKWTAISQVGLYVPGGKNPFPTVQQILAVAATEAGCERVISCISPKGRSNEVLIAAHEVGISEIYRLSGAQAIAAMAYGTESIAPVDIIAGPGNPYVTAAKIICQAKIAIDMPAGPSEAIILADSWTPEGLDLDDKARYCAADILARAEHGSDSAAVLVTDSQQLAELTKIEIEKQFDGLMRKDYIATALGRYCAIIVTEDMTEAVDFTNDYAPEHLEILVCDPESTFAKIQHAASVFIGLFNPVATGDYASGVNHTLPTGGWASKTSPVGVWTFMKRVQYSHVTKKALHRLTPIVQTLSNVEGLDAHCRSVEIRFESAKAGG